MHGLYDLAAATVISGSLAHAMHGSPGHVICRSLFLRVAQRTVAHHVVCAVK